MNRKNALAEGCYGFLPSAGWAWEALRRNVNYRREYFSIHNKWNSSLKLTHGGRLIRYNQRQDGARKWGLSCYANPELCANHAQVFWHPDVYSNTLKIRLTHSDLERQYGDILDLSGLPVRKTVLDIPDKSRQIRIFAKGYWVQLRCNNHLAIRKTSRLEIQLRRIETATLRLKTAMELLSLYENSEIQVTQQVPTNHTRLKRYLQAYDIRVAGGTYRDIAIAFEGTKRVEEDWNPSACYLKDRSKRAFKRGEALVD